MRSSFIRLNVYFQDNVKYTLRFHCPLVHLSFECTRYRYTTYRFSAARMCGRDVPEPEQYINDHDFDVAAIMCVCVPLCAGADMDTLCSLFSNFTEFRGSRAQPHIEDGASVMRFKGFTCGGSASDPLTWRYFVIASCGGSTFSAEDVLFCY